MLLLLAACQVTVDDSGFDGVDETLDYEIEGNYHLAPPAIEVAPYTDQAVCWFTTYDGDDVGVVDGVFRQHPDYGHHVIVMRTKALEADYPDGSVFDCTEAGSLPMTDMEPFVLPSNIVGGGTNRLELPDGMANKLKADTRLLVQSHHINFTGEPILVNDRIDLTLAPVEDIDTWAAPLVHTNTDIAVKPGEDSMSLECTFEEDLTFLYLLGHMHEWGASFALDHHRLDGTTERIYEIGTWDVLFRDLAPVTYFEPGEFSVKAGESFTTHCDWFNDTDEVLGFPAEMCVSTGIVYPQTVPIICDEAP